MLVVLPALDDCVKESEVVQSQDVLLLDHPAHLIAENFASLQSLVWKVESNVRGSVWSGTLAI